MERRPEARDRELQLGFAAIRRFSRELVLWGALIAVPVAVATYLLSARSEPSYSASASLVAPKRTIVIEAVDEEPGIAAPHAPAVYSAALHGPVVLRDAWQRLVEQGQALGEPSQVDLDELSRSLSLDYEDRRLSLMLFVIAEAPDSRLSRARANAATAALIAWDDARARSTIDLSIATLESQQQALQAQLERLLAQGDRVALAQSTWVSQLLFESRQDLAMLRSQAVGVRGALDLLQGATGASQLSPNPSYDAVVALLLTGILVAVALILRNAVRVRFSEAAGLAEAGGLPLLATFTSPPDGFAPEPAAPKARERGKRPAAAASGPMALPFLKAHVDRALPAGGRLLVVGVTDRDGARPVAAALAMQYRGRPVDAQRVQVATGPALLAAAESLEEAAAADATVVVADPTSTTTQELELATSWLRLAKAHVLGLVASPALPSGPELGTGLRQ